MRKWLTILIASVVGLGVPTMLLSYTSLLGLEQQLQAEWAEVLKMDMRRADLVPNLAGTIDRANAGERGIYAGVMVARLRAVDVARLNAGLVPSDEAALEQYQQAQDRLQASLSRLMAVARHRLPPNTSESFRQLTSQLEGAETRIAVARMRFNEASQAFNKQQSGSPTAHWVGLLGWLFAPKPYFAAAAEPETVPAAVLVADLVTK